MGYLLLLCKEIPKDLATESETVICYGLLLDSIVSPQAFRSECMDEPVSALEDVWSYQ
jgi:hypothetical protein